MVDPQFTAVRDTPNKSIRQNVPRKGACLHHGALTSLSYLRELVTGAKQVSSTAIVKDDARELIVGDDAFRAWSLSSAYWDSALRSVETCNESTTGWTISDASHRSLGRLVAYWAERDGFWPHRDGDPKTWTVLGHREVYTIHGGSYGTACPGGMDLNLVTRYAQEHLLGRLAAEPEPEEIDMSQITYVERVYKAGDNTLKFDGEWMIVGRDLGVDEKDAMQDGYRFTTDPKVAMQWAKLYGYGEPNEYGERQPIRLIRDPFISLQTYARKQAAEYRRTQRELFAPAAPAA